MKAQEILCEIGRRLKTSGEEENGHLAGLVIILQGNDGLVRIYDAYYAVFIYTKEEVNYLSIGIKRMTVYEVTGFHDEFPDMEHPAAGIRKDLIVDIL